jgi:GxxExxY protein
MARRQVTDFLYEDESYKIRGAAFEVWKNLKGLFKERIVENALKRELQDNGLRVESQKRIDIYYNRYLLQRKKSGYLSAGYDS